jgi:hypothetical protein
MRLMLRVLLLEFVLSWATVLAGLAYVAMQIWLLVRHSLPTRLRGRGWRMGLGLMIAIPVIAGWPAMFLPSQAENAAGDWLTIAIPWWILIGVLGLRMLALRLTADR